MGLLDGKVAIVTGGGGGIGRCHALALAEHGAKVVVNNRTGSKADSVVEEIRQAGGEAVANYDLVGPMECGESIVATAVESFGRLDIVINNAGFLRDKSILKMDEDMWDTVVAVHLKGTFSVSQAAGRRMREQGDGGRIINTASISGMIGLFGQANYGAAKAGVAGFTRILAMEMKRYEVTANVIVPEALTRMTEGHEDIIFGKELCPPEMMSPIVIFLASDLAKDVTGRIFGIFGRRLCEFKYVVTPGVEKPEGMWTPEEIADKFDAITRDAE